MSRRPTSRRKVPRYFANTDKVVLEWSEGRGWEVKFWSEQLHRWDWESLPTVRVGKKLEGEAKAAAVKLLRAEVCRYETAMAALAAKAKRLSLAASGIESGERDWSSL
jgi:hypothetical protein